MQYPSRAQHTIYWRIWHTLVKQCVFENVPHWFHPFVTENLLWRSHKSELSKTLSTNPIACMRVRSGGWHYSTAELGPEATKVPVQESWENPCKIRPQEKGDNMGKLTVCVWSKESLTRPMMSLDQAVLISITWLLLSSSFCPAVLLLSG